MELYLIIYTSSIFMLAGHVTLPTQRQNCIN